ncbi:MAG: ABC transporter permease [Chloroflexi bacterium]|nr:MAG: ABC transporter permease [Chloroflexota bacterium]
MLWLAARSLLARRLSTAVTGLGLLIATLGFNLLASTSQTASAVLHGDIASAWSTPYDLLVRPAGSVTSLERADGLVRPNYVSGLAGGGITLAQLNALRGEPYVEVAAPIAVSGYALWRLQGIGVTLPRPNEGDPVRVYRLSFGETTDAGMSRYSIQVHYLVVASSGWFRLDPQTLFGQLTTGDVKMGCGGTEVTGYEVSCWAPNQCFGDRCGPAEDPPGYGLEMLQPVLVAGIDPVAEARLAHLDRCVVNGRYLNASDSPEPARDRDPPGTVIPALLSDRSFVDATLTSKVERTTDPWAIVHGGPTENAVWTDPQQTDETVDAMYRQYIPHVGEEVDEWPLWSAGDVEYMQQAGGLVARTSPPDTSVLQRANFRQFGAGDTLAMPAELQDRWFRAVTQRSYAGVTGDKYWSRIGTYDPTCLPGFTQLAGGGGLDAYTVPEARLAGGKELLPNRSLAGYLNTPPAASIHESTGLAVDIVRGSSTRDISVRLPAGDFGRAAVEIAEGWSVKGVAVTFSSAVSTQNIALFALALLAAFVLVATTGYIAARRRHAEFGVLRALGWPSWRIGGLVASEMGWLGLVVGLVTVVVTLVAGPLLRAPVATPLVAATLPIAIGVGLAASAPAALAVARNTTIAQIERPAPVRRSRRLLSIRELGLVDMLRTWRVEALAAAGIIALGAALLASLVLVVVAFRGELDSTVLGVDLAGRVRPFHFVLAALTVAIASLGAGQIVSLSYLERRPQLAVLRALGWSRTDLGAMIAIQVVVIACAALVLSTSVVLAAATLTGASAQATWTALGASLAAVVLSSTIAASLPVVQVYAGTVIAALREE